MAKKARASNPKDESKRDKFIRLGEKRMTAALKYLKLVGNLAGPGYEYTSQDSVCILETLAKAVDGVRASFAGKQSQSDGFTFVK